MAHAPGRRRVVITGLGCVTPLGATAEEVWRAAAAGRSGVAPISRFDTDGFAVSIAAQAPDEFDLGDLPAKEARRLDRFVLLSLAAAREALADAALTEGGFDSDPSSPETRASCARR